MRSDGDSLVQHTLKRRTEYVKYFNFTRSYHLYFCVLILTIPPLVGSGEISKAGLKVIPFLHLTKKVPDDLNTYSEKYNPQKQVPNLQVSESEDYSPGSGVMK